MLISLLRPIPASNTSFPWSRLPASSRLLTTKRRTSSGEGRPRRPSTTDRLRTRSAPGRETSGRPKTFAPRSRPEEQRGVRPTGPTRSSFRRSEDDRVIGTLRIDKHDRSQQVTRPVEEQGLDSRGKKHRHATKRSARSQRRSALFGGSDVTSQSQSDSSTRSSTKPPTQSQSREPWAIQKAALKTKLQGEAWNPRRRLSPTTIEGIRAMHANNPAQFTTSVLAEEFDVSAEEIRRILKSKWKPSAEEAEDRNARWERRGERIWNAMKEERGYKVPKPWRERGVGRESRDRDFSVPFEGTAGMQGGTRRETRHRDSNVPFERDVTSGGREKRPSFRSAGRPTGIPSKISISETIASALAMSKGSGGNGKGTFAGKIL